MVDVGGGTMHVALVRLTPRGGMGGQATVLAKRAGRWAGTPSTAGWCGAVCQRDGLALGGRAETRRRASGGG